MSEAYEQPGYDDEHDETPNGFDLASAISNPNIAHDLDDMILTAMGAKVVEEFKTDELSLQAAGWDQKVDVAMKAATQVAEAKDYPWPKASNVKYPLVTTAAIQFNARAMPAVIDGPSIVKGKVLGAPTPEKQDRADRIGKHMSWQLLEEMDGWEEDTDKLLIQLPIVGCAFRKTYFDPLAGYNCSRLVPATKFVVEYMTKDLASCPRMTHVLEFYPHQIREKMKSGLWLDVDLGEPLNAANDDEARHDFLEQHRLWDLDGDDYPEPYIVTVHKETQKVVRVVARFDEKSIFTNSQGQIARIEAVQTFTKYSFIPNPDGSFYDIGFGTLLGPLGETINSTINQIMDAGHLANVQGGFIGGGISIKSGNMPFRPGEWRKVDAQGGNLAQNVFALPTKEPSSVLYQLMVFLTDAAKDVTATQDIMTGDTGRSNQPVGTTLAIIEQGLKTFTAIVKRVHRALKAELKILYRLNSLYLDPQVYFEFEDSPQAVAQQDYAMDGIDVVPVSDPSMATDMQKMGRAQFMQTFLGKGLDDMAIIQFILETAGIPDTKRFMPKGPPAPDPKLLIEQEKLKQSSRKLDQADISLGMDHAKTEADVALTAAQATNMEIQNILAAPQFQDQAAQMVFALAKQLAGGGPIAPQGLMNAPPVQPGNLPGMAPQPADGGVPPVPQGPADGPDGAMGGGGGIGPTPPDQGPPMGGIGSPGVG